MSEEDKRLATELVQVLCAILADYKLGINSMETSIEMIVYTMKRFVDEALEHKW